MRTKDEILKELGKNRQWGAFGGISPDTEKIILVEIFIDIRDILEKDRSAIFGIYDCLANKD